MKGDVKFKSPCGKVSWGRITALLSAAGPRRDEKESSLLNAAAQRRNPVVRIGKDGQLRVLLVHPGGPFWARKDAGAWTIPKGEYGADEEPLAAARREFFEELGCNLGNEPLAAFAPLGEVKQKAGKLVAAFALEGDLDAAAIRSNTFDIEWPPKSGKRKSFPEVDRAAWFSLEDAREKINPAQMELLERLATSLRQVGDDAARS